MTALRRRWSFSLRMMFVGVTVLACGLGWFARQACLVRERQRWLLEMPHCGGTPDSPSEGLPWSWRVLGATRVGGLDIGCELTQEKIDRLRLLFPEEGDFAYLEPDDPPATRVDGS